MKNVYIHPTSIVETEQIGEGTRIWAFSHIMQGARVGSNCNVGEQCFIESGVMVGANVTIKNGNALWEGVTLEDGVFVGPRVFFTNDLYPRSPRLPQVTKRYSTQAWRLPTLVKFGASLGAGAIILPGLSIGEFCMVAAGAVVTKSVPGHALVMGSPARVVGWVCECGRRLEFAGSTATCIDCGLPFVKDADSIQLSATHVVRA
jgi:acetyltransferase-like isoleucine patch superfamily enzyme